MPPVLARVCRAAALGAVCAAAVLAAPAAALAQATEGLKIVPLVRDDQVLVSFDLADGFTSDLRAAIKSGLPTTFIYSVELRLDVPFGVDRLIGTATVTSGVEYDNLKRRYTLNRMVDGRTQDEANVEDESTVRQWLTSISRLALFRTSRLEENRDYYVRVYATARPSNGSIFWPFGSGTSAQTKFTFIK
jgi:hypothetical protein